jgi:hypothetical protein
MAAELKLAVPEQVEYPSQLTSRVDAAARCIRKRDAGL